MPLGSQRWLLGIVASATMPIANSARLQAAIAWKVPMWFCTPHHFGAVATQRPGSSSRTTGLIVRKYGAFIETPTENARGPPGGPWARRQSLKVEVGPAAIGALFTTRPDSRIAVR